MEGMMLRKIGSVVADDANGRYALSIDAEYREAMLGLEGFSRIHAVWWAHGLGSEKDRATLSCELPYAPGTRAGVFACRSPARPNPIAISCVGVLGVDRASGEILLDWIDAVDGTPLLDVKPYIAACDRAREYREAAWLAGWPVWIEEAAAFFGAAEE
jgi:tRNA-Thr(GGU) m(6)t(6)A37 methyltransferase TsaA